MPELNKQGQEAQGEQIKITIDGEDSVDNSVEKPTGNISKKPEGSILDFPVPKKPEGDKSFNEEPPAGNEKWIENIPAIKTLKRGDTFSMENGTTREILFIKGSPETPEEQIFVLKKHNPKIGETTEEELTGKQLAKRWPQISNKGFDRVEALPDILNEKDNLGVSVNGEKFFSKTADKEMDINNRVSQTVFRSDDPYDVGPRSLYAEGKPFINSKALGNKVTQVKNNNDISDFNDPEFKKWSDEVNKEMDNNKKENIPKPPDENIGEEQNINSSHTFSSELKDSGLGDKDLDVVGVPEYNQVAQERALIVGANKKMDSADIEKQRERTKRILEEARSREAELDQRSDQKLESLKKQLDDFKSDLQEVKSLLKDLLEKKPETENVSIKKGEEVENIDPSLAVGETKEEQAPVVEDQGQVVVDSPEAQEPPPLPERNQAEAEPNTSLGDEFAKELQKQFESNEKPSFYQKVFDWLEDHKKTRYSLMAAGTGVSFVLPVLPFIPAFVGGWKVLRAERFKAESQDWAGRVEKMVSFLNSEDGMYDKSLETLKNLGIETNSEIAENMAFQMYFGEKEKRERNKLIENEIVKKSLEKLESKLSGRANAEMIRADIEKRLRQRLEGVRKGNNEKAASDFAKIYRDGINKGWWKNYIWGTLAVPGYALGLGGVHYLPWPQNSLNEIADALFGEGVSDAVSPDAVENLSFSNSELSQSLEVNKTPVSDLNIDTGPVVGELDQPVLETLLEGGAPVEFTPEVAENFINNLKGTVWDDTKAFLMENHLPHDNQSVLEATKQVVRDSNELSRLSGGPEIAVPEWGIEGDIPDTRLKEGFSLDFNGLAEKFNLKKGPDLFDILSGKNPYQEFLEFDSETNLA